MVNDNSFWTGDDDDGMAQKYTDPGEQHKGLCHFNTEKKAEIIPFPSPSPNPTKLIAKVFILRCYTYSAYIATTVKFKLDDTTRALYQRAVMITLQYIPGWDPSQPLSFTTLEFRITKECMLDI